MSESTTQKPYLLRALYEWCVDNGQTPYIAVMVDANTRVPMEFVRKGEIVLNIGPLAAHNLRIGNAFIEFSARFGGVSRQLQVPVGAVAAIYARENGQGMTFEVTPSLPPDLADTLPQLGQLTDAQHIDQPRSPDLAAGPLKVPDVTSGKVPTLIAPLHAVPASTDPSGDSPEPRPPAAPGARPALRRIK